jgi:uncharacterized protein
VLETPLHVDDAVGYLREWLGRPNMAFLPPGSRHLEIAFGLVKHIGTVSNLTTDVQLAALAIEHDAEMHSNDADFARFPDLAWVNPLRA